MTTMTKEPKLVILMSLEKGKTMKDIHSDLIAMLVGTLAQNGSQRGMNLKDVLRMFP